MTEEDLQKPDSTESLIETLHATRRSKSLVINPDYLDDEKLPEEERAAVLKEIFNLLYLDIALSLHTNYGFIGD